MTDVFKKKMKKRGGEDSWKTSVIPNLAARCQCDPTLPGWTGQVTGVHLFLSSLSLPRRDGRCGGKCATLTDKPRRVSTETPHFQHRSARIWAHSVGSEGKKSPLVGGGSESHLWRTMSSEGSNERFEGGSLVSALAARHSPDRSLSVSTV